MVGESRRWCAGSSKHEHDVHLSTEHFTVTTSDIDPVFHICEQIFPSRRYSEFRQRTDMVYDQHQIFLILFPVA